jgi:exonuclease VII small subunit
MWKKETYNVFNDPAPQRVPATLTAYREAGDEFSKLATQFLEHVPLLNKARDSYQRALAVSSELRSILNAGDETLRALMAELDQAITAQLSKPLLEKKKLEPSRLEVIKLAGENGNGEVAAARVFP